MIALTTEQVASGLFLIKSKRTSSAGCGCQVLVETMFSLVQLFARALQSEGAVADAPTCTPTRPMIFLAGGPSGVGKDTLLLGAKQACDENGAAVVFVARQITRAPSACTLIERPVTDDAFDAATEKGEHAISWAAHGVRYAIPAASMVEAIASHPHAKIVLNVSRGVFDSVQQKYGDIADVYVLLFSASKAV